MTMRKALAGVFQQEDINFLITNRIPRRLLTRFFGWFSKIERPLVRDISIGVWQWFSDLDLSDAKTTQFRSLHDCFTRELREGARPVDGDPCVITSPCDGIVGSHGRIHDLKLFQIKGLSYKLLDLIKDRALAEYYREGHYLTLRLTASMYHRFHAPYDCRSERVTYISGDTWNVNPIALRRVEHLFCRNERAVLPLHLKHGPLLTLVAVGAILVASVRFKGLEVQSRLRRTGAQQHFPYAATFAKGEEIGWFEHGSTIVILAPGDCRILDDLETGRVMRMGEPIARIETHPTCQPLNAQPPSG